MEENSKVSAENKEVQIDSNLKEIMKKESLLSNLSETEKKKLIEEINNNFNFDKLLQDLMNEYNLKMDKYVVFTNGKEQLYYENGEFFIISTIDSKKAKRKVKREEARNLYNEFYIMTVLNPLLKQKQENGKITSSQVKSVIIEKEDVKKDIEKKEEITEEVKKQVKQVKEDKEVKELNQLRDRLNELKEKEKTLKAKRKVKEQKERN